MRTRADYITKLPVLLVVAVLVVSTVPATVALAQIGESEPNDSQSTATPITVDETVEGEITSDDEDWFSLDGVQAGQSVEASVSVPTDSDGLYAYLYGPNGYTGSGQYVDPGETAQLGATAVQSGAYYVRLYASGTDTGSYSFEVTTVDTDDFEPNEQESTATPASQDTEVSGSITVNDQDWFAFDGIQAGQSVEASVSVPTGSDGLYAYLYGPAGYTGSGQYVDPGETARLGALATQSGTHYVRLYASGTDTGSYSFEVTTADTDDFEPNEQESTATPASQDTEVSGTITVNDQDWFAFSDVQAGQSVEVGVSVPTDSDGLYAYLYGPNGYTGSGQYVDPGETARLGAIAVQSGTYYVRLYASGTDTGSYAFELTTVDTDDFEPNEQESTAADVSRGTEVNGNITINDQDWFAFDGIQTGDDINVTVSVPTDSDGLYAYLYGPNGYTGSGQYVDPGETVELGAIAERTGTYYVRLYASGTDTGSYSFEVASSETDEYEPNENAETAAAVSQDTRVSAEITTGDDDWFSFDAVEAGQAITLDVEKPADSDGLWVYLYAPGTGGSASGPAVDGSYVAAGQTSMTLGGIAERSGTYYVRVYASGGDTGAYSFGVGTAETDDFEPNQNADGAAPLDANGSVSGEVTLNDDEWFAVENVSADRNVTASLTRSDDSGLFGLYIYGPDGSILDSVTVSATEAEASATTTQAGTHYVVVRPIGRTTGSYDLTVSMGDPVTPSEPTAEVVFDDQTSEGDSVVVSEVTLSEGGFVVVHDASGAIIGASAYLANGTHEDVPVMLDPTLEETATLTAMAHLDDGDEAFDASADGPYTFEGQPVTDTAVVTVEDDGPGPSPTVGYYQVDFVAGDPIEDLGETLYAEEDRLMRFAFGNTDDGITDRGSAWASADLRDAVDYAHIVERDDGTAAVRFTVAEGEEVVLSLVVYSMPDETFDAETAGEQDLLFATTGTYGPGEHVITVELPDGDD